MCTDGQPQTSCVHTRTATDVLCVLTDTHGRPVQPTWAKITQTVHRKGQRAESKDQRADMCTDGQPRTSFVSRGPKSPEQATGRVSVLSPRTNMLICVLMDSHRRHVCADRHTRTHKDSHGLPVYVLCGLTKQPTWAKITRTVHGKGQRAEPKDQRADMCTDGQPQTSCSTGRTSVLSPRTNVLICVLMDSHRRPVCADGHTQTHTDSHGQPPRTSCVCVDGHTQTHTDSHGRPVCADGHPQTSCVFDGHTDSHGRPVYSPRGPKSPKQSTGRVSVLSPRTNVLICVLMDSHGRPVCADEHTQTATDVRCVLTDTHECPVCADGHPRTQPTWAKITQTIHWKGQHVESKDQRADTATDVLWVLTETDGHTRTATDVLYVLCVLADSRRQPRTSCACWRTPTDTHMDVLCVLTDTHGRPVCTEQTAHMGQNHPNSPREGSAC
ncbi:unnamed protein product [Brassica rapa]|uniref:Uncharacterized protein n=1 Tax=Brassica campestris TaxID=3711 RepID=A0A8D9GCH4_BRACM|nr:unnamed protein product [Brassica rapa]